MAYRLLLKGPGANRVSSISNRLHIVLGIFVLGAGTSASAATNLRPEWVKSRLGSNASYLSRTELTRERTINDALFDPGASRAMRTEYETRFDADEARSNAGFSKQSEEKSRFAVMKDFARRAVDTMSRIHLAREGDQIGKRLAQNPNLPRGPIAATVLAASLYTGRSMRFRIFGGTPVDSRVVLKDRVGSVALPIPSTGITTTLAYNPGGVCGSDGACALLSREIAPNVSGVVNSAQKGSASVVYSISF